MKNEMLFIANSWNYNLDPETIFEEITFGRLKGVISDWNMHMVDMNYSIMNCLNCSIMNELLWITELWKTYEFLQCALEEIIKRLEKTILRW